VNLRRPRTTRHRFGFAPWGHRRWWHGWEPESGYLQAGAVLLVLLAMVGATVAVKGVIG
jgi:hypothetical protein